MTTGKRVSGSDDEIEIKGQVDGEAPDAGVTVDAGGDTRVQGGTRVQDAGGDTRDS